MTRPYLPNSSGPRWAARRACTTNKITPEVILERANDNIFRPTGGIAILYHVLVCYQRADRIFGELFRAERDYVLKQQTAISKRCQSQRTQHTINQIIYRGIVLEFDDRAIRNGQRLAKFNEINLAIRPDLHVAETITARHKHAVSDRPLYPGFNIINGWV